MKQPLLVMPPAQAEILYDAALEDEQYGIRQKPGQHPSLIDDWDDRESVENYEQRRTKRHIASHRAH